MAHLIQRLSVEFRPTDPVTDERKKEIRQWLEADTWQRTLAEQLDQLVPKEVVLRIPQIEIDISADGKADFQHQMVAAILKEVRGFEEKQKGAKLQKQLYLHEIAIFYLIHGYLSTTSPSFLKHDVHHFIEAQLTDESPEFWQAVRQKAIGQPVILRRLSAHLGLANFRKLICKILHINPMVLQWIADFEATASGNSNYPDFDKTGEIRFWQNLFSTLPAPETFENQKTFEQHLINQINATTALPKTPAQLPETKNGEKEETNEAGIFLVENAGLVLLTPFFSTLFRALGWVRGKEWESPELQQQAVRLLAYVSHGTAESYEFDWPLNKFLCGLPMDAEIDVSEPLSPDTLALADEMLASVIGRWSVLKNTSEEGLRNNFLKRNGKLQADRAGQWKLTVPRKTEDILLEMMPWGFSVIKLPWMDNILFVDW